MQPTDKLCPNCLMMKWEKRLLYKMPQSMGGHFLCETHGGCKSQFTEGYLTQAAIGVRHLLEAMDPKQATFTSKVVEPSERKVDLPEDQS